MNKKMFQMEDPSLDALLLMLGSECASALGDQASIPLHGCSHYLGLGKPR